MREGDSLWMFCVGCSWSNGVEKAPPPRKEFCSISNYVRDQNVFVQSLVGLKNMGVSLNGGTPKTPQNDHF